MRQAWIKGTYKATYYVDKFEFINILEVKIKKDIFN